mmetsp:Transcript_19692/g.27693  ORF Transcript_19692/g.27693 Transcript_19692/m.27693 type:complete len:236 (-) Transcript_19692:243-950(-)|eukprot:CAMPEP_0184862736 /NCGR_PEP_ID=MMETSP0580-20130426/7484_1 /TAXON_ID=1118495 /ORGANISM="Dactyliosolen fragilissimus" /LENGTH=235 /DNA_ID=CAMNT_0027360713 /DNA_START=120 /DNA_END=827 /DNA_ORIENTATION=+
MSNQEDETMNASAGDEEEDLEKLQAEIAKMEEEAARIAREADDLAKEKKAKAQQHEQQNSELSSSETAAKALEKGVATSSAATSASASVANTSDTVAHDSLSIYVGQVDYSSTPEELLAHFEPCGTVERVTIVCDKFTGHPKGFAYLEFQDEEAVGNAIKLDGSIFKGRTLKVTRKRVNDPEYYYNQTGGRGGGRMPFRGGRGGGRFPYRGGRSGRGYRGGFRGRGYGGGYHPYY